MTGVSLLSCHSPPRLTHRSTTRPLACTVRGARAAASPATGPKAATWERGRGCRGHLEVDEMSPSPLAFPTELLHHPRPSVCHRVPLSGVLPDHRTSFHRTSDKTNVLPSPLLDVQEARCGRTCDTHVLLRRTGGALSTPAARRGVTAHRIWRPRLDFQRGCQKHSYINQRHTTSHTPCSVYSRPNVAPAVVQQRDLVRGDPCLRAHWVGRV